MRLDELNALDAGLASQEFLRCCGSRRWAQAMMAARPFATAEAMVATARATWAGLEPADWLDAFAAHPRIGRAGEAGGAGRAGWAAQEQAGAAAASGEVRTRLVERNRDYEARFGYIFIVCATGKSAGEILAILERRMTNEADDELRVAADEQQKITALRLAKLLDE
jgi:2-oxo-4-hydroxy-4-carboxy-5-ureidoimidazoline decarboxylase